VKSNRLYYAIQDALRAYGVAEHVGRAKTVRELAGKPEIIMALVAVVEAELKRETK